MAHNVFKGLGIALVTPFNQDGAVDYTALNRLLDYQVDNGADFFCILATTGETPTLTADEKKRIKDMVVQKVGGKMPILVGCGGNNTAAVVEELQTGDYMMWTESSASALITISRRRKVCTSISRPLPMLRNFLLFFTMCLDVQALT